MWPRSSHLVASCDKQEVLGTYSNPDPPGIRIGRKYTTSSLISRRRSTGYECTAFSVDPLGFYEFTPVWPIQRPRHISELDGGVDDLTILANGYKDQFHRLKLVFRRLQECGLKLAPKTCKFFYRKVAYIGHVVCEWE